MRDYLRKDVLKTLTASDIDERRECITHECVNGHKVTVEGTYAATTLVGLLYRVYDPSVKIYNYIIHVGITTQDGDVECMDDEYEKAYYNAVTDPVVTFNLGVEPYNFDWDSFSSVIIQSQPKKFVRCKKLNDIVRLFKKIGLMK